MLFKCQSIIFKIRLTPLVMVCHWVIIKVKNVERVGHLQGFTYMPKFTLRESLTPEPPPLSTICLCSNRFLATVMSKIYRTYTNWLLATKCLRDHRLFCFPCTYYRLSMSFPTLSVDTFWTGWVSSFLSLKLLYATFALSMVWSVHS